MLRAAASDAEAIRDWLAAEGFEIVLLTDTKDGVRGAGRVLLEEVTDAITSFCQRGTLDQLVIYFAGHGLQYIGSEIWLLSGAPDRSNEAINLVKNIDFARDCGIPNVVLISDACRLIPRGGKLSRVEGVTIFPNLDAVNRPRGRVDRLLPASPNSAAFEADTGTGEDQRAGIFTTELLAAHGFPSRLVPEGEDIETTLVRLEPTAAGRERVIDLAGLAAYLETRVPIAAAERAIAWSQQPECIVEAPPRNKFIGRALFPEGASLPTRAEAEAVIERLRTRPGSRFGLEVAQTPFSAGLLADLESTRDAVYKADRQQPLRVRTGIQISGDRIAWAASLSSGALPHEPRAVDMAFGAPSDTVLLQLESMNGVAVAVFEGYVASLKVVGGRLMNVSYLPFDPPDDPVVLLNLDLLRADVVAKARHGIFHIATGEAADFARRIRTLKRIDPTLGLYAAYAYQSAGRRRSVTSVLTYMRRDLHALAPFDVALLAKPPRPEAKTRGAPGFPDYRTDLKDALPFCPMLMQGWSFLRTRLKSMPPRLEMLMGHLVPSLWTTFDP
ncbi:hypothetical protein, partial [Methylorubrum thiocyanatum]